MDKRKEKNNIKKNGVNKEHNRILRLELRGRNNARDKSRCGE